MKLSHQREFFDLDEDVTYLNSAFMSPQLKAVKVAGEQAINRRSKPWTIDSLDFFTHSEKLRWLAAHLFGTEADNIAIIPSASYGISTAARNIPIKEEQEILLLQDQHPSNVYAWYQIAKERNAKIVTVSRPFDFDWTRAICEAVTSNTAVVSIPHAHWTDGSCVNLNQVRKVTRNVGAALVVDASQSMGAFPLKISEIDPDFLVSVGYKWLLGPYSLAYLYVNPTYHNSTPIELNWITRKGSSNFSDLSYKRDFETGARRFDMGERSNFTLIPMAIAALEQIHSWSVSEIQIYLNSLTLEIEKKAIKLGLLVPPIKFRVGHFIGIHLNSIPRTLATNLLKENIFVSIRGSILRVAPYLHNSKEDIASLFYVIERLYR